MYTFSDDIVQEVNNLKQSGLYKHERELLTPQGAHVATSAGPALNFCANNYLGLANHPQVVAAAQAGLTTYGFGMSSVRFICGTQEQHTELERRLAAFVHQDAAILFSSCFDANGGLFEVLLTAEDAVVSDELNHASLIDGIRLCKAHRYRYRNGDVADLRIQLAAAQAAGARRIMIVTDGVFSMDGLLAPLPEICDAAEEFSALVVVDDSHATGFVGPGGAGTAAALGVSDRVDIITSTLGKALGGASGGFIAGPPEIVELLRQRARPYLFSNSLAPAVVAGSLAALQITETADDARAQLTANAALFRTLMAEAGFELVPGSHAIVPVMFPGEAGEQQAVRIAEAMLERGIYVVAFSYPVVPRGKARIRVQLSAAHSEADIRACVRAFEESRAAVA